MCFKWLKWAKSDKNRQKCDKGLQVTEIDLKMGRKDGGIQYKKGAKLHLLCQNMFTVAKLGGKTGIKKECKFKKVALRLVNATNPTHKH